MIGGVLPALVARDLGRGWRGGALWMPIAFFLLVATLFPFAVGPDAAVLTRIGAGVAWVAALLAALLPVDRLVAPDSEAGVIDQLATRGIAEETVMVAKIVAHWLGFAPPLLIALWPVGALLRLDGAAIAAIAAGLLAGTPGLAALAVATAALTTGLRGTAALAGLVMLPLAIPLLIFGSGGSASLTLAVSLALLAGAPFVAGAAIRAGRG